MIVEDFFSPDELEPCKGAIADLVDNLARRLYAAGKIPKLYTEYGLFQRLSKMEEAFPGKNKIKFWLSYTQISNCFFLLTPTIL